MQHERQASYIKSLLLSGGLYNISAGGRSAEVWCGEHSRDSQKESSGSPELPGEMCRTLFTPVDQSPFDS